MLQNLTVFLLVLFFLGCDTMLQDRDSSPRLALASNDNVPIINVNEEDNEIIFHFEMYSIEQINSFACEILFDSEIFDTYTEEFIDLNGNGGCEYNEAYFDCGLDQICDSYENGCGESIPDSLYTYSEMIDILISNQNIESFEMLNQTQWIDIDCGLDNTCDLYENGCGESIPDSLYTYSEIIDLLSENELIDSLGVFDQIIWDDVESGLQIEICGPLYWDENDCIECGESDPNGDNNNGDTSTLIEICGPQYWDEIECLECKESDPNGDNFNEDDPFNMVNVEENDIWDDNTIIFESAFAAIPHFAYISKSEKGKLSILGSLVELQEGLPMVFEEIDSRIATIHLKLKNNVELPEQTIITFGNWQLLQEGGDGAYFGGMVATDTLFVNF
tara:strand:- start:6 stop:1175 length:1170 start_codon:yes stop_codon:yes gene_type:complete